MLKEQTKWYVLSGSKYVDDTDDQSFFDKKPLFACEWDATECAKNAAYKNPEAKYYVVKAHTRFETASIWTANVEIKRVDK